MKIKKEDIEEEQATQEAKAQSKQNHQNRIRI